MILDSLDHASQYKALGGGVARALDLLLEGEITQRPIGRYDIDDGFFFMIQEYDTRTRDTGVWEAHRKFTDLQCVLEGVEVMGRIDVSNLTTKTPYDDAKDVEFFDGGGDFVQVPAGSFAVFFPHDAHMPCMAAGDPAPVRKIVFKIAVG